MRVAAVKPIDKTVLLISLILLSSGIVFVYSSSFAYAELKHKDADFFFIRHGLRAIIALACFLFFIRLDYHFLGRISPMLYLGSAILLTVVLVAPSHWAINGAKRWVQLGPLSFQASELARIALVILVARQCEKCGDTIKEVSVYAQQLLKIGIICILIVLEPNHSTALIIACVGLTLLYISGARIKHLVFTGMCGLVMAGIVVLFRPYIIKRLLHFFGFINETKGVGYQAHQSLIALGHGGWLGVGIGKGEQKFLHLPEPHTDFVISILGEEVGFVGMCVIILLLGVLLYRGMLIAQRAPDRFGQILACGLTLLMGIYAVIHIGVDTQLLPTTGVPFPFLSYGGMNLIFTMTSVGILLNISSQSSSTLSQTRSYK